MGLYERLGGFEAPKIPVHGMAGVMQEFALGNYSAVQAATALNLNASEQTEAATLLGTITSVTNPDPTIQGILRRLKAIEIQGVLFNLEHRYAPQNTVAAVKTRLGVS